MHLTCASSIRTEANQRREIIDMKKAMGGFNLRPVPPGLTLKEAMEARDLSANALALKMRVPANRISDILRNKRAITAETAMRLGRAFGTSAEFWFNLQGNYDLSVARKEYREIVEKEVEVLEDA